MAIIYQTNLARFLSLARQRCAHLALCLLLLAGCGDSGTGTGLPPRVSITPDQPVSLYVGDTLTVRATIRNSSHPGITYHSTAPEIVQVDPVSGLATALAPGVAILSGVSQIDPRVFAQTEFTVLPDLPASIELLGMTAGGGAVDPSRVSGAVRVRFRVEAGNALRLEVHLRERLVCQHLFSHRPGDPAPPASELECEIDTRAFDEESTEPWFVNGAASLTTRLVASGERAIATAPEVAVTLRNPPRLVSRIGAERQAVDSSGDEWLGGELSIEVIPVLYEAGSAVAAVTLEYSTPAGGDTVATTASAPFSFTFGREGVLGGVTDAAATFALTSELDDGSAGPSASSSPIRFDGAPPRPGAMLAREWIGAETRFVDTYVAEGESDDGVGRIYVRFHVGDPGLTSADIVSGGTEVEVGSDLEQRGAGSYRVVAQVCDGLDNCALEDGYDFGVDLTPPLIDSVSLPDRVANPEADLVIGVRDDLSGFPGRMLEVAVEHLDNTPGTVPCGPSLEGLDLPGRTIAGGCAPDTLANRIPVPRTTAGYYRYTITTFDRAGNRSEATQRSFLVDLEAPWVGPVELGSPLVPGEELTAQVEATDDVDLAAVDFRLVYPLPAEGGSIAIPFGSPQEVGAPFDDALTRTASASASLPFVRTLTLANETAAPRSTLLVDSMRVTALDAAGLSANSGLPLPPSLFGGTVATADPFPRFTTAEISADRTSVCSANCGPGDPTSLRISARVEGESGTGRPFARIHFYRRDASGFLTHLGSLEGTEATITNAGNRSSHVYALEYEAPAGIAGEFGIVAIGVNSRGGALATSLAGAPIVSFYRR